MKKNCLNKSDFTYKALTKAFSEAAAIIILKRDPNFTLEDSFLTKNLEELSVSEIRHATMAKDSYTDEGLRKNYEERQQKTEFTTLQKFPPDPETAHHIMRWFGYDLYDPSVHEVEVELQDLIDYVNTHVPYALYSTTLLEMLKPFVEVSAAVPHKLPFKITLAREEDLYPNGLNKKTPDDIYAGHFDTDENTLRLFVDTMAGVNKADIDKFARKFTKTLNHELTHALTVDAYITDEQFQKEIDELYELALEAVDQSDAVELSQYGLTDAQEFMAEALSNVDFQLFLAKTPFKGSQHTSLWQHLMNILSEIFRSKYGVKTENTLLDATLSTVLTRIERDGSFNKASAEKAKKLQQESDDYWTIRFEEMSSGQTYGDTFGDKVKKSQMRVNNIKRKSNLDKYNLTQGKAYSFVELKNIFKDQDFLKNPIYDQIEKFLISSNVTFIFDNINPTVSQVTTKGKYDLQNHTITIEPLLFSKYDIKKTMLHESIHAVTVYVVNSKNKSILTKDQQIAVNNLELVLNELRQDAKFQTERGILNVKELLAELANPLFVQLLKDKKFDTTQSFWQKIISEIVKLLKLNTSAYDIVQEAFENIIQDFKTDTLKNVQNELAVKDSKQTYGDTLIRKHTEESVMEYFWKTNVINRTKFKDAYWVTKDRDNQLLKNLGVIERENQKIIAQYGVPKFFVTRTKNSAIVEVNPEYLDKRNNGTQGRLFKLADQVNRVRSMETAVSYLTERLGEDAAVQIFSDTVRIGDDFAHGWFDSAGVHLWNQSMIGTEYHEAFHAVFHLYNTDRQQRQLLDEARQKYGENLSDLELEERMADDYMTYTFTRNDAHLKGFDKIIQFVKDLYNYLKHYFTNKLTIEQIYSNIYSNKINKRFKRNLSSLGHSVRYKRMYGFTTQGTTEVLDTLARIVISKKARLKKEDKKSQKAILDKTREWTFNNAWSINGRGLSTGIGKNLEQLMANRKAARLAYEESVAKNEPQALQKHYKVNWDEAINTMNDFVAKYGIEAKAPRGTTPEERQQMHQRMIAVYNKWKSTVDGKYENRIEQGWEELLILKLRTYGLDAVENKHDDREDHDDELMDREMVAEKIYNMSHFKESLRNKLSTEIKIFLRSIELDESHGLNILGFRKTMSFDDLYLDVALTLTQNNVFGNDTTDYKGMKAALRVLSAQKPYLGIVVDQLEAQEESNPQLISAFYTNFATSYQAFISLSHEWMDKYIEKSVEEGVAPIDAKRDLQRELSVKLYEPNRNKLTSKLVNKWSLNATENSNKENPDALYRLNDKNELVVDKTKIDKAVKIYKELTNYDDDQKATTPQLRKQLLEKRTKMLSDFLKIFGADVQADHILQYLEKGIIENNKMISGDVLLERLINGKPSLSRMLSHFGDVRSSGGNFTMSNIKDTVTNVYKAYSNLFLRFAAIEEHFAIPDGGSFMGSGGQSIYPYNLPTPMSDLFTELKQGRMNPDYAADPTFVPTSIDENDRAGQKYESIFLRMFRDAAVQKLFTWYDLDGYKQLNEDIAKFDYESSNDNVSLLIRTNAFLNNGEDTALYAVPTMSDRMRMGLIKFPRYQIYSKYGVSGDIRNIIRSYIEQDLRAIHKAHEEADTLSEDQLIEGWHYKKGTTNKRDKSGNAFKFWNIFGIKADQTIGTAPKLVDDVLDANAKIPLNASLSDFKLISKKDRDTFIDKLVNDYLEKIETEQVPRLIKEMIDFGVIRGEMNATVKDGKTTYIFVAKNFRKKTTTDIDQFDHMLSKEGLRKRYPSLTTPQELMEAFAKDFILNQMIVSNEITKFTRGSRGYAKNYEDFNKRFGGMGTPGNKLMMQGSLDNNVEWGVPEFFYEAVIDDLTNSYEEAEELAKGLKTVLAKNKHHIADAYRWKKDKNGNLVGQVNKTDAFGVITLKFARSLMQGGLGKWTKEHEEAYVNYNNGGEFKDNSGKAPLLMPIKPYYDGMVLINGKMTPVMIKNSYQVLIRDYTKDHPTVQRLLDKMESQDIDAVNTVSTRKLERHGMVDITQENYDLVRTKLPSKHLRIPQIIPDTDKKPLMGSQWRKDIIANLIPTNIYDVPNSGQLNGREVFVHFNNIVNEMIRQDYDELMNKLNLTALIEAEIKWKDTKNTPTEKQELKEQMKEQELLFLQNLREMIEESIIDRELSENYMKALHIVPNEKTGGYRFKIPLSFPAYNKKFNQILFSIFRNRVLQQKMNGMNAVQVAEIGGIKVQKDNGKLGEKHLRFIHVEDGVVRPAECAIKLSIAELYGIKPGDDLSKIPEEQRQIIGYRIPTQGQNSMLPMVVKYFLPDSYSHAILVPGEITMQMGSDFDVDKLFLMLPNLDIKGLNKYLDNFLTEQGISDTKDFWTKERRDFKLSYVNSQTATDEDLNTNQFQLIADGIDAYLAEKHDTRDKTHINRIKANWDNIKAGDLAGQSREQLENALFELAWGILTNKEHLDRVIESRDDNMLKDQADFFRSENEELDFNYPGTEQVLEMRNKAGSKGIGTYANFLSGHNILQYINLPQRVKIDSLSGITEVDNSEDINIFYLIKTVDKDGKVVNESKKKKILDTFQLTEDLFGGSIAANISRHLGISVDNAKDPIMFWINDNAITSNVTGLLLSKGLDTRGATWFRNQPIIIEFVNEIKKRDASPFEYDSIREEIFKKHGIPQTENSEKLPINLNIDITVDQKGKYVNLTGIPDIDRQDADFWKTQGDILYNFIKINRQGMNLVRMNKVLMSDRIKDMSSLAAIQNYEDTRALVMEAFQTDLSEINTDYPLSGGFYRYGILGAKQFFTKSGLFLDLLSVEDSSYLKSVLGKDILDKSIYEQFQSDKIFYFYQLQPQNRAIFTKDKFYQLFEGKNNLVVRWNNLQKLLGSNEFFMNYEERDDPNSPYRILRFNTHIQMSQDEKNAMIDHLRDMLTRPFLYTENLEEQKEIQSFAEDLIYANLWQFGFENKGSSIVDLVPPEWFDSEFMNNISMMREININELPMPELFMDSFVANNSMLDGMLLTFYENRTKNRIKERDGRLSIPMPSSIAKLNSLPIYYRYKNTTTREYEIYSFDKMDAKKIYYKPVVSKGIPYRMKEFLVFDSNNSDNFIPISIIKREKVTNVQAGTALNAYAEYMEAMNEESRVSEQVESKPLGDITEYMMTLTKKERAEFREVLVDPMTILNCKPI